MKRQNLKIFGLGILILFAFISSLQGIQNAVLKPGGSQDFEWDAARKLLHGQDPYESWLKKGNEQNIFSAVTPGFAPTVYPPSCLLLVSPYALFSWPMAKNLWAISNIIFTFFLIFYSFKLFLPNKPYWVYVLITTLFVIGTPWRNLIGNGQKTLFSLAFFTIAIFYCEKKPILSGWFLSLSLLKYSSTLPLSVYFLYKKKFLPLILALAIHVTIYFLISFYLLKNPYDLLKEIYEISLKSIGLGYLDIFSFFNQRSFNIPVFVLCILAGFLFLITIVVCVFQKKENQLEVLSLLALVSMVIVRHLPYDFIVLLFPVIYCFRADTKLNTFKILILIETFLIWYFDRLVAFLQKVLSWNLFSAPMLVYAYILFSLYYLTIFWGLISLSKNGIETKVN